jgi:CheY-like chemotaxis protein
LTASLGPTTLQVPRARLQRAAGEMEEWRSRVLPRYQRRTARVDEAILGVYLSGTNSRRLKGALAPLLRGGPLSKDAVSRLVGRLKSDFEEWQQRDLSQEAIRYLMLDGWYPKVRIHPVDVILLDVEMPGVDGSHVWIELMQLSPALLFIPINDDDMATRMAHAKEADVQAMDLPGDTFVKLSDHEGILARIRALLSVRRWEQEADRASSRRYQAG